MKIELEINSCMDCPHFTRERYWTADSWEESYNWFCNKRDKMQIQGYVEWNEVKDISIPEWCPAKPNNEHNYPTT